MMSPAIKQMICKVAGAGLLLAAIASAAADTAGEPATADLNTPVATTSAAPAPETQNTSAIDTTQTASQAAPAQNNKTSYYQNAGGSPQIGSGGHLLSVTLGLLLIVGLIFGLSWFVKRFGSGSFAGNAHLKIIATMPLGTRERIVLIDAGGQQLLLGITPTHINTLHTFATPVVTGNDDVNTSEFGRKLMAILQRPNQMDEPGGEPDKNNPGTRK